MEKTLVGFSDEDADGLIEVGEKTYFALRITVTNNDAENAIEGVVVKDRLGGDLQLDDFLLSAGTLSTYTKGKTDKVFLTWEVGDLEPGSSQTLDLLISTDITKRQALYSYVLETLHDQAVYLPLTYLSSIAVFHSRVGGVCFGPTMYEIPFDKMSLP